MRRIDLGTDSDGRPLIVDSRTLAKLRHAESELNWKFTIVQGSYRGADGAAASAGTHDAGGVIDLRTWNLPSTISGATAVKFLREAGLIAWYRTPAQGFDQHIHAIDYGNPELSDDAADQVIDYEAGRNGLASNGPDDGAKVLIPKHPTWLEDGDGPLRIDGIDISHHQSGGIDWATAKRAGVRFVYHKATEGTSYRDSLYSRRRAECKAADLPFGGYHFARPEGSDAVSEARAFIEYAQPEPGDLKPALDLETNDGAVNLVQWASEFVTEVERLGFEPIIYTPYDLGELRSYVTWRPRYNNSNTPPTLTWDIWQFSDGVYGVPNYVPGVGHVDINTFSPEMNVSDLLIGKEGLDMDADEVRRIAYQAARDAIEDSLKDIAEKVWTQDIGRWPAEDGKPEKISAAKQLNQARGYAQRAFNRAGDE